MKLVLTEYGTAELHDRADKLVWTSDADDDFLEEFGADFLNEEEADDILEYLLDEGIIDESEIDNVEIFVDTLDAADADSHSEPIEPPHED